MNRACMLSRVVARACCGAILALSLAMPALVAAQPADDTATAGDAVTTAAEQPRRGRDRRRATEAKEPPATPPVSAVAAVETASAEQPAEAADQEIVCKNYKPTGSRMARRLCGTAEQWAAIGERTSEQAGETMRQMRERSAIIAVQPDNPLNPNN